jgi:hypothetical protein
MQPIKFTAAFSIALLLFGCSLPSSREPKPPAPTAPPRLQAPPATEAPGLAPPPGGAAYRIDPTRSELRLLVFRAGPMARLGHDHVIVNRGLAGWVDPAGASHAASFALVIPAADFLVDDAAARAAEGAEFAEPISDDARQGTRRNMLGEALLDAEHHAQIQVRSIRIEGAGAAFSAEVSITVAGHESRQRLAFVLEPKAAQLTATADFRVRQSSLGLTPFSVLMGALAVQDEVRVKLSLVAVPVSTGTRSGGVGQRRDDQRGALGSQQ